MTSLIAGLPLAIVLSGVAPSEPPPDKDSDSSQPVQELTLTRLVYPQEKNELQVTVRSLIDDGPTGRVLTLPLGVEYGLTDRWQIGLELTSWRASPADESGAEGSEPSFETQYSFMNLGGSRLHAAIGFEAALDGADLEPYTTVAVDVSSPVQVLGEVSVPFVRERDAAESERSTFRPRVGWNVGALVSFRRAILGVELASAGEAGSPARVLYFVPSVTFRPARRWEVGVGLPLGLAAASGRPGLAVQATYER